MMLHNFFDKFSAWFMSGAPEGGALGAHDSPRFGQISHPYSDQGADYAHHISTSPPDFWTYRRPGHALD